MKWLGYAVAFAIGALAIIIPQVMSWDPEMAKTSMGFGIGVIVATVYAAIRGIPIVPSRYTTSRTAGTARTRSGETGVVADFVPMEWFDWVVLLAAVVGGFIVGWLV